MHHLHKLYDLSISNRTTALLFMLAASILASFSGLLIRSIEMATAEQINIYRSLFFASVIALGYSMRSRGNLIKEITNLKPPVFWAALCLGITGLLVPHALIMTTIANNAIALSTTPFLSLILAYFFLGESISRTTLVAMITATCGIAIMVFDGLGSGTTTGNLLALLVALGFSSFAVIVRGSNKIDMIPCLFIAGLIVIAGSILGNDGGFGITGKDLLLCMIWGVILSGIAHWIFIIAAQYLLASELTLFTLFELALAPIWVWIFYSEKPQQLALLGGLIVILSVLGRTLLEFNTAPHSKHAKSGR